MSSDEGRIKAMHARHGLLVGHQCGECARLWQQKFVGGTFWKCREYRITRGTETDWRVRWLACGQFEPAMGQEPTTKRSWACRRASATQVPD